MFHPILSTRLCVNMCACVCMCVCMFIVVAPATEKIITFPIYEANKHSTIETWMKRVFGEHNNCSTHFRKVNNDDGRLLLNRLFYFWHEKLIWAESFDTLILSHLFARLLAYECKSVYHKTFWIIYGGRKPFWYKFKKKKTKRSGWIVTMKFEHNRNQFVN